MRWMKNLLKKSQKKKLRKHYIKCHLVQMALELDFTKARFYQQYWSILGEDIYAAVLAFLNCEGMFPSFNYTNIALIPKVNNPIIVNDFRSISFVIYNLVSKVVANRLKMIMLAIISSTQSAFISRRLISWLHTKFFILCKSVRREERGL